MRITTRVTLKTTGVKVMGEINSYLNSPLLMAGKAQYKVVRAEPCNAGLKFTLKPVVPSCIDALLIAKTIRG